MRRSSGTLALFACVCALALSGCGQKASAPAPTGTPIGAAAADAEQQAAADAKAAELAAKEEELAAREAALREQELAAREAAVKADEEALAKAKQEAEAAAKKASAKPAAKPASSSTSTAKPAPKPIVVPAGTQLAVALAKNVNTKIARLGDPVSATLASDLVIDGRKAAKAGAEVRGSIVQLVSGSDKIGGTPTLGLKFDTLVAADGATKTINASYLQQGKSDTGKDTAKILGAAAAGAVIGHQVDDDDKGTVIGGLVGAGAGAAAAKKTGGEIKIVAGTVLNVATQSSFEVAP